MQSNTQKSKKTLKRGLSYGRVSTFDQAFKQDGTRRDDASPEAQKSRCLDYVKFLDTRKEANYRILEHISDEGFSGKNTKRPGYQKMLDLIASNTIDFIVTTELSRISRSVLDFLELVAHCEKYEVDLIIIGLELDTASPIGRVMVIILVALAQFEREMTSQRVKENALNRLLKDGKINGAAEILGLDRDPKNTGHFLINHEELIKVEKILKLFLRFASKGKVLAEARRLGLTGKKGRELTLHMVESLVENAKWRYRGLWYANKENENKDHEDLPDSKKFQIVELPHGPLVEASLLDKVEEKLEDTYKQRKRSGKDGRVYLLTHILEYEDGSKYYGGAAKDRQYFYYFCKGSGPTIPCKDIESAVIAQIKGYFKGNDIFKKLVENAIKKRIEDLPRLEHQISFKEKELSDLEVDNKDLRIQLRDKSLRSKPAFMDWLEEEVTKLGEKKTKAESEISLLYLAKADLIKKSNLENLEKTAAEFISKFTSLTGIQQRSFIERMIAKIVIKKDNKLELYVLWDSKKSVTRTTESSIRKENGGREESGDQVITCYIKGFSSFFQSSV